jgi:hypothetical protein
MHGNDHVGEELSGRMQSREEAGILLQALWRIQRLELRSKVEVARVMAAPHGACSEACLGQMARLGYDAACVSRGSLAHHNPGAPWLRTLGMGPCDIVAGLPILPRFRLSSRCQAAILIAALLRQPIIPVGHHQDAARGFDVLAELAGFINGLGTVHWAGMSRIVRSQYSSMVDGKALLVRLHAGRADIRVPSGIEEVRVEPPASMHGLMQPLQYAIRGPSCSAPAACAWNEPISVVADETVVVRCGQSAALPDEETRYASMKLWPIIRRLLTEGRDRLAPTLRRIS